MTRTRVATDYGTPRRVRQDAPEGRALEFVDERTDRSAEPRFVAGGISKHGSVQVSFLSFDRLWLLVRLRGLGPTSCPSIVAPTEHRRAD